MDHIDSVDVIRNSIHFRSIVQRDPLVEFKNEAVNFEIKLLIFR
jgi:preprotein translocase subunit SecA